MRICSDCVGDIMVDLPWFLCWLFASYMMYSIYGSCHVLISYLMVNEFID